MDKVPENARQGLATLVPASVINDITCFVLYDQHPRDDKNIDLIICTKEGVVKEYFQREPVCSYLIERFDKPPSQINLFRNSKCELFYIVEVGEVVYVLSRRKELQLHKKVGNVEVYDINDSACMGLAFLKVLRKDDAVPIIFDDNFDRLDEQSMLLDRYNSYDNYPLSKDLMRKLIEAKFGVKVNEKAYKDLLGLRQNTAFCNYQGVKAVIADDPNDKAEGTIDVITKQPWIKLCNKKIVLVIEISNRENVPLEDVHVLLHRSVKSTLVYTTKVFTPTTQAPFWTENESRSIIENSDAAIVAIIDSKELKHNVISKIELNGVICTKYQDLEQFFPIEDQIISACDVIKEEFDVLYDINGFERLTYLALLSTTNKVDLHLRVIKDENLPEFDLKNSLHMEKIGDSNDVFVHRISPHHILFGVMVVFLQVVDSNITISVHARSSSQILTLVNYINDAIPHKIIITDTSQKITAVKQELRQYNEPTTHTPQSPNFAGYGKTIQIQAELTLQYFDNCMIQMHESKDANVQSKLGSEIDIFACGVDAFKDYRTLMLQEAEKGNVIIYDNNSEDIS